MADKLNDLVKEFIINLNNVRLSKITNDKRIEVYDKLVEVYYPEIYLLLPSKNDGEEQ